MKPLAKERLQEIVKDNESEGRGGPLSRSEVHAMAQEILAARAFAEKLLTRVLGAPSERPVTIDDILADMGERDPDEPFSVPEDATGDADHNALVQKTLADVEDLPPGAVVEEAFKPVSLPWEKKPELTFKQRYERDLVENEAELRAVSKVWDGATGDGLAKEKKTEEPPFPVKFSWEPNHKDRAPEGYRVVVFLPSTGTIRVEAPEMTRPAVLRFEKNVCYHVGPITDQPEAELLALRVDREG